MDKVCAVIVTYNRISYLKKCLEGLQQQSYKLNRIFIFDNHSTDNTIEFIKSEGFKALDKDNLDKKIYYENTSNEGGAGGFAKAIQIAQSFDDDFLWIMDDDVFPTKNCLKIMLNEMKKNNVKVAIPNRNSNDFYDRVTVDFDLTDFRKWWIPMRKIEVQHPLLNESYFVKDMAFEGPLISMDICKRAGIPNSGYFLEFDDTDYAFKLQKYSKLLYVTNAKLIRQITPKKNLKNAAYNWRNYYTIRNTVIFDKKYGKNWKVRNLSPILLVLHHIKISIQENNIKENLPIILKAYIDGIKGRLGKNINPDY